jgi:hypothetical protein
MLAALGAASFCEIMVELVRVTAPSPRPARSPPAGSSRRSSAISASSVRARSSRARRLGALIDPSPRASPLFGRAFLGFVWFSAATGAVASAPEASLRAGAVLPAPARSEDGRGHAGLRTARRENRSFHCLSIPDHRNICKVSQPWRDPRGRAWLAEPTTDVAQPSRTTTGIALWSKLPDRRAKEFLNEGINSA